MLLGKKISFVISMGNLNKDQQKKLKNFLKKNAEKNPLVSAVYQKD